MDGWLIPAAPVTVVEDKKAALLRWRIPIWHRRGPALLSQSELLEHPDARHHCVALGGEAPDDSQQPGFQTTATGGNGRATDACAIDGQRRRRNYCRRRALLIWWYSAGYSGRAGKAYGGGVNQALRRTHTTQDAINRIYFAM